MDKTNQGENLYTVPFKTVTGEETTLAPYQGKIILIVNVASRCGFTKQYAELEALYQDYKEQGLAVLAFPCNQFLKQEPGDNAAIKAFAESCFRVSFPIFAKVDVRGKHQSPLYQYLKGQIEKKPLIFIPWNFSKILISPSGQVLRRYSPLSSMQNIRQAIDKLLVDASHSK